MRELKMDELIFKTKDIMTNDFIRVESGESIKEVSDKMARQYRDEVLVVDKTGKLLGIFTSKDLTKIKNNHVSFDEPIIKYAVKDIVYVEADRSARSARDIMVNKNIGRLPVVENGNIIGIVTSENIRDGYYPKLEELFNLQSNIMDNLHEGICIVNAEGIVQYWNASSEKLYGVKSENILHRNLGDFFKNAMALQVLKNGKRVDSVLHEPNEGKFVILSAVPIFNAQGKIIAAVSTDRDVTEVMKLSRELETEKSKVEFFQKEYQKEIASKYTFSNIIGKNKKIIDAITVAQKVAPTSTSVMITGKSGTGKEVFARSIHEASGRKGNFVAINCSAIPESLFESELFGYVEGAFTGAVKKGRAGKFEMANNGTLFLDEIGDMPMDMQVKLLRVLQDGMIYRLGSEKPINTNARIIAATHKDLMKLIDEEKFREDLYYRLAVVQIKLPSLCERKEDVRDLAKLFLEQTSSAEGIKIKSLEEKVYRILTNYRWDGNIRELKNVIQRMVVLSSDGRITTESIPEYVAESVSLGDDSAVDDYDLEGIVGNLERKTIREVMEIADGNKQKAAKMLKIKRSTLYYKLEKYGIM
ncbi:MAG TPA: sigma-54 dependent transcriptional regulator PrdR [Clostridiaceae bacterium]|nr:sigma-54 dependent transcriptional regulator PrdR [Clostridiaceae bacterium]